MNEKLNFLKEFALSFEINLTEEKLKQFELFGNFLKNYNSHTNLVSANDINLIYEKHFADSLSFGHFLSDKENYKIIDIGSGGGFPVIPLAIVADNSKITAVDSTKKKTDFLLKAAACLGLKNLTVLNVRAEELAHSSDFREKFNVATARAVGNLAQISELCLPFVAKNGLFVAYKAAKVKEETEDAQNAISILGGEIDCIFDYTLQLNMNFQRNLVAIKKIKNTPLEYPRSFSGIKNKQL